MGYLFGAKSCHCDGEDCCSGIAFVSNEENQYYSQCCAYLFWHDDFLMRDIGVPVGFSGSWPGDGSSYGPYEVTSTCGRAFYLDYLAAGEPEEHVHLTTTQQSVVMTFNGAIIEVFLDEDCCPESIQVNNEAAIDPALDNIELRTGPGLVESLFDLNPEGSQNLEICDVCETECECDFVVQGRSGAGVVDDGVTTETWSLSVTGPLGVGGFWTSSKNGSTGSEETYSVSVGTINCTDGQWVFGGLWRTQANTYTEGLSGKETIYDWNVSLVLDEDGCPSSVSFDSIAQTTTGPNGGSVLTPLAPPSVSVSFSCNPFP